MEKSLPSLPLLGTVDLTSKNINLLPTVAPKFFSKTVKYNKRSEKFTDGLNSSLELVEERINVF